jgi:hypothetical protein
MDFPPGEGALAGLSQREGDVHKHDDVGDGWNHNRKIVSLKSSIRMTIIGSEYASHEEKNS